MPITVAGPRSLRGLAAPLGALVRAALALEERRAGEIGLTLTDDEELRALNARYRGLDRATDVLSFGYSTPGGGTARRPAVHGDIAISMDRVLEQAGRYRVSPGRELARLAVHGALHLAGLDHQRPPERRRMRAREQRALRAGREAIAEVERALGGGG
jgi:probable rRNA maturation factor